MGFQDLQIGEDEGLAKAAMVLAILGLLTFWFPFLQIVLGVAAVLCGYGGRNSARGSKAAGGMVLGGAAVLIGAAMVLMVSALLPYTQEIASMFQNR